MTQSIDALFSSSLYQSGSSQSGTANKTTDADFNDVLSQLQRAADELTNSVEVAEKGLSQKLGQLYEAGQRALVDPRAIQWTDDESAAAARATMGGPSDASASTELNQPQSDTDATIGIDSTSAFLKASQLYGRNQLTSLIKALS